MSSPLTIYRLDASIRKEGSVSRAVADSLETALIADAGSARIVHREIGLTPIPSTAWQTSVFAGFTPEAERTAEQREARALAATLADELVEADAYIFAVPLYNFGVSQHFKLWMDLLLTDPRFAPGGSRPIAGRPAILVTVRGGGYGAGTPRHGWDHATPWYQRMLADVLGLQVELVETELTLADVTPAMESLRSLAAENLRNAHDVAGRHGKQLAASLRDETPVAAE